MSQHLTETNLTQRQPNLADSNHLLTLMPGAPNYQMLRVESWVQNFGSLNTLYTVLMSLFFFTAAPLYYERLLHTHPPPSPQKIDQKYIILQSIFFGRKALSALFS